MGVQIADDYIGGSPVLGDASTMGATGKGAFSFRLTGMERHDVRVSGQTVRTDSTVPPSASTFRSDATVATAISIDGVAGAWGGWPVGSIRMGGIDLLGSIVIAPNVHHGDFHVRGTPVMFGTGIRIGITEETRSLPAMSLTGVMRYGFEFSGSLASMPTDSGQSVGIDLSHGDLSSLEYRFAASKTTGKFGVSGGIGHSVVYVATDYAVDGGTLGRGFENTSFNFTRTVAFVGATYTRDKLTYGAELRRVMGGDLPAMVNTFGEGGAMAARNYLSLGVRVPIGRTVDRR